MICLNLGWAQYCLKCGIILLLLANVQQQRYYRHLEEIDLGHRQYAHDLKSCMVSIAVLAADGGDFEPARRYGGGYADRKALYLEP